MDVGEKVDSQWVLMIKTPNTFHTHSRSSLYIYIYIYIYYIYSVSAPSTMAGGHKDTDPAFYLLLGEEEWMLVQKVDSQSVLMIKTPNTFHISSLYIYNAI